MFWLLLFPLTFAEMIEKKRQEVQLELEAIEKRGRWRQGLGESEGGIGQATSAKLQTMVDMETLEAGDKENRLEGNTLPQKWALDLFSDNIAGGSVCITYNIVFTFPLLFVTVQQHTTTMCIAC
jgi:hypothetical protein